jgi:prepilin-type N-terminal cleavage/methylation domain-containing protein/prepilin-type processing-associated H-X9-DG protein
MYALIKTSPTSRFENTGLQKEQHMQQSRSNTCSGFTLIELLVVISIISILIAILLPALGSARGAAQAAECMSNQRTVGQGFHMYANDYDNFIVPARMDAPSYWNGVVNGRPFAELMTRAGDYSKNDYGTILTRTGSFSCPAETRPMLGNYSTGVEFGYYHFQINSWIAGYNTSSPINERGLFHRFDDLRAGHPDVLIGGDSGLLNAYGLDYTVYINYRHHFTGDMADDHNTADTWEQGGGSANFLFADGHVGSHGWRAFTAGTAVLMTGRSDEYGFSGWYLAD